MRIIGEFREFAVKGNVVDMAVGIIIGGVNVGLFLNAAVSFLIVGLAVFLLVRTINRIKREEPEPAPAPADKACPYCRTNILIQATRCPNCTSQLEPA